MAHYYSKSGEPCHVVPKKDGNGTRATTIRDARANGWLPSVTTILDVLNKPPLVDWKLTEVALATLRAPKSQDEQEDQWVKRVKIEAFKQVGTAADLGTGIHSGLESGLQFREYPADLLKYCEPVLEFIFNLGKPVATEQILVGDGYAGKADLILAPKTFEDRIIVDFKSCKVLPEKGSWPEHRLQLSAYSRALWWKETYCRTMNVYISTVDPGRFIAHDNPDVAATFEHGFRPLLEHWQWANDYRP